MHLTVSLSGPPASVRGRLRNAFLEPQPNLFVGTLATKQVADLIAYLETEGCLGVVIAHTTKSPMGARIKNIGAAHDRAMLEFDGLQLVKRLSKQPVRR